MNEDIDEDTGECQNDWKQCCCEACEDKRADYGDYLYEQMKDREYEQANNC